MTMSDQPRTKSIVDLLCEPMYSVGGLRVIKTGRTVDEINAAAKLGLRPLVKPVRPNKDIHYMVAVLQDPETGEIKLSCDRRDQLDSKKVIDYTFYYPYHFPNPFAAYLIPADLAAGEEVWLEDLIEDLVAVYGNQGYHPRLKSASALWTGYDFVILFNPSRDAEHWIG